MGIYPFEGWGGGHSRVVWRRGVSSRPSNPDWPVSFPYPVKKATLFHDLIHFVLHTELSYNVLHSLKRLPFQKDTLHV